MLTPYLQIRRIENQKEKLFHLYAFLSVLMQMEMPYTNGKSTKVFLGIIADKVIALQKRIDNFLDNAVTFDSMGEEEEEYMKNDTEALRTSAKVKKINQQYSNIRGACGLIGIKLKAKYSVHDALNYAKRA